MYDISFDLFFFKYYTFKTGMWLCDRVTHKSKHLKLVILLALAPAN